MNARVRRSGISAVLLVLALLGCGGGGGGEDSTPPPPGGDGSRTVTLNNGGEIVFPEGGLPEGSTVSVRQVPYPVLDENIEPLGEAYEVTTSSGPLQPVTVKLPVPAGQDGADLAIIRVENSGQVTLLDTRIEGPMLVAQTPGFSTFAPARLKSILKEARPLITGPEVVPVNTPVQYRETKYYEEPGLVREWRSFDETKAGDGGALGVTLVEGEDGGLGKSTATLSAAKAGSVWLMMEVSIPSTTIKTIAYRRITVIDELPAGNTLDVVAAGPTMVELGSQVKVTADVINTGDVAIKSWRILLDGKEVDSCGVCGKHFSSILAASNFTESGARSIIVEAVAEDGATGAATLQLSVLGNAVVIHTLEETSRTPEALSAGRFIRKLSVTYSAEVGGSSGPYTYEWIVQPDPRSPKEKSEFFETHVSDFRHDDVDILFKEPGNYEITLRVKDAGMVVTSRKRGIYVKGDPINVSVDRLPANEVSTDEPVAFTFKVQGGELVHNGKKFAYAILIDWGDGSVNEHGGTTHEYLLPADSVWDVNTLTLSHKYETPGRYTVKYLVLPAGLSFSEVIGNISSFDPLTLEVTVVEAETDSIVRPVEAVCPSSVVVEEQDTGVVHTLEIDSLTHVQDGYVSVCSYEEQGLGGSADFHIYLSYNPDSSVTSHGCGRAVNYYAAPHGYAYFSGDYYYSFSNTTMVAWSTQRTVAVSWNRGLGSAIPGSITVQNNNEEVMLVETINRLVAADFGAACPSL